MTPGQASTVVGIMMAAYPDARWSDESIELYETLFAGLDYETVRAAVGRLICTQRFLPKVSEILERVREVTCGPARTGVEAWGDVMKAIRRVGSYGLPEFDDPIVATCVRIMGWRNLCLDDVPMHTDRARFCELYEDQQRKQIESDVSEPARLLPAAVREPRALEGQKDNVRELPQGVASLVRNVGAAIPATKVRR